MKKYPNTLVTALLMTLALPLGAEVTRLPDGSLRVTESQQVPQPGLAKSQVQTTFGNPLQRYAPVGAPAISSWEYPGFQVYFENDVVLHTVIKVAGR